jgi:hypothetical protein|tara:strand:+ start:229 stop:459 length:231 start_codon:yes stop_codon:yes gene_type:complete
MVKPNKSFDLTVDDITMIETALNGKVHRRAMSIAMDPNSIYVEEMQREVTEIRDLLGRLHNQKTFYRPKNRFSRGK